MRARRTAWTVGGILLVACGVLGMLQATAPGSGAVVPILTAVLYAAAVLLFAVGLARAGSVVDRRPLGTAAMVVTALWPIVDQIVANVLSRAMGAPPAAGWTVYGYVSLLVPAAAGLVAAVQIARAGVVPHPWRWAPVWVLAVDAAVWAGPQIVLTGAGSSAIQSWAGLLTAVGMLGFLAGTLGLGILALLLAARERPGSVEVYRSARN